MTVIKNDNAHPKGRIRYHVEDIKQHNKVGDLWMILWNNVYDISNFIENHPGGGEVLLDCGGVDATVAFEDVCHSQDALQMLEPYFIGEIYEDEITKSNTKSYNNKTKESKKKKGLSSQTLVGIDSANREIILDHSNVNTENVGTVNFEDNIIVLLAIALLSYGLFSFIQWKKLTDWILD